MQTLMHPTCSLDKKKNISNKADHKVYKGMLGYSISNNIYRLDIQYSTNVDVQDFNQIL